MSLTTSIKSTLSDEFTEMEAFTRIIEKTRKVIDARLCELLCDCTARAAEHGSDAKLAVEAAQTLCLRGGKRMRAALVAVSCEACGGEVDEEVVISVGMAVELLQTYLLIHDDWIDNDDLRRGGPSVHAMLRTQFSPPRDGDSAAILAGDYLSALAQEVLLSVPAAPDRIVDAARVFARMHEEVQIGQLLDLRPAGRASVEAVHDMKTGSYTVRGPLLLGAALSGASDAARTALKSFAAPLGVAFQLRDDLLGVFGDTRKTGKPAGNDLRQGKRTALIEDLEADMAAAPHLAKVLGVEDASAEDVETVVKLLEKSGVRARAETRIADLLSTARRALVGAPLSPSGLLALRGATTALGERSL